MTVSDDKRPSGTQQRELPSSPEADFKELFEAESKKPEEGDILTGRVVAITQDAVLVDIGYKSEGHVPIREFMGKDGVINVKVGDDIKVLLEKRENDKGYLVISRAKAEGLKVWDEIIVAGDSGRPIEGVITERIKGGFYVNLQGVTAFLPGSQVDLKPVKNQDKLVGQSFLFKILKYDKRKNNVIVSRRALLEEERDVLKKSTLTHVSEGALLQGTVKNITDYGAFIDLGGVDGLVHLTDMSWGKVTHPSHVLNIGDTVTVKVLKYNREDGKISLGIKQTTEDPWIGVGEKFAQGGRVKGRVVNLTDYGAFVEIAPGVEGLVHISEMSWTKIKHPSQKFKVNDAVEVVVLDVDPAGKRISLSAKQAEGNPWRDIEKRHPKGTRIKGHVKNITDFGVFIGVEEGIDGLVHVSDLSWKKMGSPSEVFKKGQEVEAIVVNVDAVGRRFSLSTKLLEKNPWEGVEDRYKPGMTVEGRVTSLAEFGAFVELESGLEGLVHISELNRGKKKGSPVQAGDIVEVEILNVDREDSKIGLSIRGVKGHAGSAALKTAEGGESEGGRPPEKGE